MSEAPVPPPEAEPVSAAGPSTGRRVLVAAVLVVLLAAAGVADRTTRSPQQTTHRRATGMPVASPEDALSSSWFCPGATADAAVVADVSVVVVNTTAHKASGTLTVVPSQGDPKQVPLAVEARSRASIRLGDVVASAFDAALVDLDQGGVAVEYQTTSANSISTAPCASSASSEWHLAEGSTERDDSMFLTLYNPFPDDAIVDLSFATDQGKAVPADDQGIVVKGGRLVVVNVGDHVRRRAGIAVTASARTGRFVMGRLQLRAGPPGGASIALAAPSPSESWYFPDGLVTDGVTERYHLYNPSDHEAQVEIDLSLDQGSAEPFDLTVPAHDRISVNAQDEERIPRGVGHSAIVRSVNGVPVVAERSLTSAAPAPRTGIADLLGIRAPATRWSFAVGGTSSTSDEWLTVQNTDATKTVKFTVTVLAQGQTLDVDGLAGVEVPAGGRMAVRLTDHVSRPDLPLVVTATGPVAVERGLYLGDRPGVAVSAGIPLG